jgi:hypothetical protein
LLGEVFLLGNWKNYDDLENNLSMPELVQTFKSMQKTKEEKRKFLASLQGVDLGEESQEEGSSFEEVRLRAMGINANTSDVVSLQGQIAAEAGFGIGAGLGYSME